MKPQGQQPHKNGGPNDPEKDLSPEKQVSLISHEGKLQMQPSSNANTLAGKSFLEMMKQKKVPHLTLDTLTGDKKGGGAATGGGGFQLMSPQIDSLGGNFVIGQGSINITPMNIDSKGDMLSNAKHWTQGTQMMTARTPKGQHIMKIDQSQQKIYTPVAFSP